MAALALVFPWYAAVMLVEPAAFQVTSPLLETVAFAASLEVHVASLVTSVVLLSLQDASALS